LEVAQTTEIFTVVPGILKIPLGRPKHRWEDNIKVDILEVEWGHGLD